VADTYAPILEQKYIDDETAFSPVDMLRETRRQKSIEPGSVPEVCVLDPDGDIAAFLEAEGLASPDPHWACYHTQLLRADYKNQILGILPFAVGGSFGVLVAEQLFASGCRLLISITSAGQIAPIRNPPYFVLISRALRDEGTSYHYLPANRFSSLSRDLIDIARTALADVTFDVEEGATWTTDAPYRETERAISARREEGILAVEMEAASLYAFAEAREKPVICFAHITNQMGTVENDFEKGANDGSSQALEIVLRIAQAWKTGIGRDPA
jgi:uridine phosphorylase